MLSSAKQRVFNPVLMFVCGNLILVLVWSKFNSNVSSSAHAWRQCARILFPILLRDREQSVINLTPVCSVLRYAFATYGWHKFVAEYRIMDQNTYQAAIGVIRDFGLPSDRLKAPHVTAYAQLAPISKREEEFGGYFTGSGSLAYQEHAYVAHLAGAYFLELALENTREHNAFNDILRSAQSSWLHGFLWRWIISRVSNDPIILWNDTMNMFPEGDRAFVNVQVAHGMGHGFFFKTAQVKNNILHHFSACTPLNYDVASLSFNQTDAVAALSMCKAAPSALARNGCASGVFHAYIFFSRELSSLVSYGAPRSTLCLGLPFAWVCQAQIKNLLTSTEPLSSPAAFGCGISEQTPCP